MPIILLEAFFYLSGSGSGSGSGFRISVPVPVPVPDFLVFHTLAQRPRSFWSAQKERGLCLETSLKPLKPLKQQQPPSCPDGAGIISMEPRRFAICLALGISFFLASVAVYLLTSETYWRRKVT